MDTLTVLVVLGGSVILILAMIAGYYLLKVRSVNVQRKQQQALNDANRAEQRVRLNRSIQIIAQSMLDQQLTLTEGAIRITVLLEGLQVSSNEKESFAAFFHLARATEHIPILEQWKSLSSKEQRQFDRQREQLENDHREFVLDAAERIRNSRF